jgi:hypothetical protein
MAGSQVTIPINAIEKQRVGYQAVSLSNFDNDSEPQVCAGSKIEIAGALFEFTGNESITGWGAIGINNDVYIKLVVADTAVTAEFTTVAPTWSTTKQGWYHDLDRYIARLYKDGSGLYTRKRLLLFPQRERLTFHRITKSFTGGSQVIPASGTWIIPEGLVQIVKAVDDGVPRLELYISGAWRTTQAFQMVATVRSDGINMRLREAGGSYQTTVWWQRFE